MEDKKRLNELEKKLEKVEAELLEQEHRPFRLLWNFWNRKTIWKDPDDHRRVATKKALLWRLLFSPTTIALGSGGVIAVLTLYFLYQQNRLFENQNDLFKTQNERIDQQTDLFRNQNELFKAQNDRIDQQTKLLEASRRSSQMFIMGGVLSDINKELEHPKNKTRTLSSSLIGRVVATSRSMKPYYYLNGDRIIERPLSPERGQLLIALVESKIDSISLGWIFGSSDFSYADIDNYNFPRDIRFSLNLSKSHIVNTDFFNVEFLGSRFDDAGIERSKFSYVDFTGTNFYSTKFSNSTVWDSSFTFCFFDSTSFQNSFIEAVVFDNLRFRWCEFQQSLLDEITFKDVELYKSNFKKTNFSNVYFENTSLDSCNLDSVVVGRMDWIDYMRSSNGITNFDEFIGDYYIDSVYWNDDEIVQIEPGYYPTLLRKKPLPGLPN